MCGWENRYTRVVRGTRVQDECGPLGTTSLSHLFLFFYNLLLGLLIFPNKLETTNHSCWFSFWPGAGEASTVKTEKLHVRLPFLIFNAIGRKPSLVLALSKSFFNPLRVFVLIELEKISLIQLIKLISFFKTCNFYIT